MLGYWVLRNIHMYWVVSVLGDTFCCSDTQYNTNHTVVSILHHTDMLLFIEHNNCHHHRLLGFFVVIATVYTGIGIGIGY